MIGKYLTLSPYGHTGNYFRLELCQTPSLVYQILTIYTMTVGLESIKEEKSYKYVCGYVCMCFCM